MRHTVYLDMDGVCCDWTSAVARLFGHANILQEPWPVSTEWLHDRLGVTEQALWDKVDDAGVDLWSELEPFPHFQKLYCGLCEHADVYFLTSPGWSDHAAAGKVRWLQKHVESPFDRFILTRHKHLLARADALLVDDWSQHVTAWNKGGGHGYLWPAPWNAARDISWDNAVNLVVSDVEYRNVIQTARAS